MMKSLNKLESIDVIGGVTERHCDRLWRRYQRGLPANGSATNFTNRILDKMNRLGC
jgi:hypothetical protein